MEEAVETKVMDIDGALNDIIFKYNLDKYYPHYRNKYKAENILRAVVKDIIQDNRKALFVGNDQTGIEFIQNIAGCYAGIHFAFYNYEDKVFSGLEMTNWKEYDKIYLISFYGSEHIERWFRLHKIKYEWIYDIFEARGVCLQREFYAFGKEDLYTLFGTNNVHNSRKGMAESILCELYSQQCKYDNAENPGTRRIAIEKCVFLSLYIRNFVLAQNYIALLSEEDGRFSMAWEEIQDLLNSIKAVLQNRKQKDIILYWLDAIPYGDDKDMVYLHSVMDKSIVFDNAFTYIPNTHPTLRAMFLGKKDIDNQNYNIDKITSKNSPLIQFLEENGYGTKIFTGYFNSSFPVQYRSKRLYMDWFDTVSLKLWDVLSAMLSGEGKKLWIVHIMEAHLPYFNSKMSDSNCHNGNERYRLSRQEIDEQLSFYDSFVNEEAFRIYMSDHGRGENALHTDGNLRFHTLFNIYNAKLEPRHINGMFSILDFAEVMKQIISDGNIDEKKFVRKYVEVCCLDRYSSHSIAELLKGKKELTLSCFGLKGIIDEEYVYIRYKTGKEWLQKRNDILPINPWLFYDNPNDICKQELLGKYRELAGEFPGYMDGDEKFKYSKYIYKVYNNILAHNMLPERVKIINDAISKYQTASVGIRMGGQHSLALYYVISRENRKKIWGFIDNNEECICSRLGLPIAPPDKVKELELTEIKAVLLSSFNYLDVLREESGAYKADVLDIYGLFEKKGVPCVDNFWMPKARDGDYEVEYPFDEVC